MHLADAAARARRHKTFMPGSIVVGTQTLRMHLLNVSHGGILAHCETPPVRGQVVMLECGGVQLRAKVAWTAGMRFGAAFLRPLSTEETRRLADGGQ